MLVTRNACAMMVRSAPRLGSVTTASTASTRTFVTAKVAQRLTSQAALWRLTGGVVLLGGASVGVATTVNGGAGGGIIPTSQSFFSVWWQPDKEESTAATDDKEESTTEEKEEELSSNNNEAVMMAASAAVKKEESLWGKFFGGSGSDGNDGPVMDNTSKAEKEAETCHSGPGKRVMVKLEDEVVESLPVMSLQEVQKCTTEKKMLVTYEGIVYDVTQFVQDHPGGAELVKTAAGLDLDHFFGNYVIHGKSEKAAQWLAPLAVGKLTPEEAILSRDQTTPEKHVERRAQMLKQKRRRIIVVASTLPFWITLRSVISWIGFFIPPLGKLLAWAVPVTVPGFTKGSEPLTVPQDATTSTTADNNEDAVAAPKVAVIGGGIAGCGAAWCLTQSGFDVTLFEARDHISGNAHTFVWDFSPFRGKGETVESCVSVTAWPPIFYKNYTLLLDKLDVETVHQPLSWFLNSKVPGYEGVLWECDPEIYPGSLREVFKSDFDKYRAVVSFARNVTSFFTLRWAPWRWNDLPSMYDTHQGLGMLNPLTVVPLYTLFKSIGGSEAWWNIVFTPQYTASFLVDELRPFPAVFGPLIEDQIPLNPTPENSWKGSSTRSPNDCNISTCVTWKKGGEGVREVFAKLVKQVALKENTRVREVQVLPNGKKRVYDEHDSYIDVDRVIFACPSNAVGNIFKGHSKIPYADTILGTPVYADDHHPSTGHMHAVMHSDASVIPQQYREECLKRASNYVEVTQEKDGSLNIENQYNFGVQTPGPGIYDLPLDQKPVMLISHALGEGKKIDPALVRGTGNHARAHPLYSGWNVAAQLSLRLIQGRDGIYYCSNWTTPGNCHDMSLLSGFICAHAIGAKYPFEQNKEARKDFYRMRDLMGI